MKKKQFDQYETQTRKTGKAVWFLLAAVILLAFINALIVFYYVPVKARSYEIDVQKKYKLLDPSQGIYNKKSLIINFQPLRDTLNIYEKNPQYNIGIYFEYLPTGANIAVNKDHAMWPASLLKIPVAMAAMKKVENGLWRLDNELVLLPEDKNADYGEGYKAEVGTKYSIEKLIDESLMKSDNTAHYILLRNLDAEELLSIYDHLGLDDVRTSRTEKLTAKRYSIFFRALYMSSFLRPEYSQKLLNILAGSAFKDFLSSGLPANVPFAHKFGVQAEKDTFADSGIVYVPDRPYILTVMIEGKDKTATEDGAKQLMKEISRSVYGYISNYSD